MTSTSLYDTFGNDIKYDILKSTLEVFLENSTIKFPLPEASADILGNLGDNDNLPIDATTLDQIQTRLEYIGFQKPNARALSIVLIRVAAVQGVHPIEYFSLNEATLKLTKDAYTAINGMRPAGSRISVVTPIVNSRTVHGDLIKP